jgi:hypothetical protein
MAKKPSKSKAKQSRATPARIPRDAATGQQFLFDPKTGEPTGEPTRLYRRHKLTADEIKADQARRLAYRKRYEAHRAAFLTRVGRRPVEMQRDGYRLPEDVVAFLRRFHDDPWFGYDAVQISIEQASEMIEAAYMKGCRQGFIEGFLYGEDKARPGALKNRERLRQQNLEKLERLGIVDRNAEIVAEFHRLGRDMPGAEDRYVYLADSNKTGRDDWPTSARQIANIVRQAGKRLR